MSLNGKIIVLWFSGWNLPSFGCFLDFIYRVRVCFGIKKTDENVVSHSYRTLRKLFSVDAADYMLSICGNDALRELSSPGKSGSFFYLTNDDRYMIKTMKKAETKVRAESNRKNSVHQESLICFSLLNRFL